LLVLASFGHPFLSKTALHLMLNITIEIRNKVKLFGKLILLLIEANFKSKIYLSLKKR